MYLPVDGLKLSIGSAIRLWILWQSFKPSLFQVNNSIPKSVCPDAPLEREVQTLFT
jgi:hypothetical protein